MPAGHHSPCIAGYRANSPEGDNFQFGYNTDGRTRYLVITNAITNSAAEQSGRYAMSSDTVSGTVYVSVWDTVGTDTHINGVNLDQVEIHTDPICN